MEAALVRTQIYLSAAQQAALGRMAEQRGAPKSQLIREAVDAYIEQHDAPAPDRLALLRKARGIWADRDDMRDAVAWVNELRRANDEARQQALQAHWDGTAKDKS